MGLRWKGHPGCENESLLRLLFCHSGAPTPILQLDSARIAPPAPVMDISQERGHRLLLEPSSYFLDDPCPFCRGHLPTKPQVLFPRPCSWGPCASRTLIPSRQPRAAHSAGAQEVPRPDPEIQVLPRFRVPFFLGFLTERVYRFLVWNPGCCVFKYYSRVLS